MTEREKWSCPVCTYANWPASRHCVCCRTKKCLVGVSNSNSGGNNSRAPTATTKTANSKTNSTTLSTSAAEQSEADGENDDDDNEEDDDGCHGNRTGDEDEEEEEEDIYKLAAGRSRRRSRQKQRQRQSRRRILPDDAVIADESTTTTAASMSRTTPAAGGARTSPPIRPPGSPSELKWSCPACTFLNWPRSHRCVQCYTENSNPPPSSASPPPAAPPSATSSSSPDPSAASLATGVAPPNQNQSTNPFGKWACKICTYENWPNTAKCAMCERRRSESPPAEGATGGGGGGVGVGGSSSVICGGRQSPNHDHDFLWLCACLAAVDGDSGPVEAYINAPGASIARRLTKAEAAQLNRYRGNAVFAPNMSLSSLLVRYSASQEQLMSLLVQAVHLRSHTKRLPCQVSPETALDIRRHVVGSLRQRKGPLPCFYVNDHSLFYLPASLGYHELPQHVQDQLMSDVVDSAVQKELESVGAVNWWPADSGAFRMWALWNRTAGDCLLDSVLQASWGILDEDNSMRRALSESLHDCEDAFYSRWRDYEEQQLATSLLCYSLSEAQWRRDWEALLRRARMPGESLEQIHVFALCHVLRRPIIILGVRIICNYRDEPIAYSNFQGVYLPLLWERAFCSRNPLCLAYTKNHFSALMPLQSPSRRPDIVGLSGGNAYGLLPLCDRYGVRLPVHFLAADEANRRESLLADWLDCVRCGVGGQQLMCRVRLGCGRPHPLVHQLLCQWLDHYRLSAAAADNDNLDNNNSGSNNHTEDFVDSRDEDERVPCNSPELISSSTSSNSSTRSSSSTSLYDQQQEKLASDNTVGNATHATTSSSNVGIEEAELTSSVAAPSSAEFK
uniref:ubiquitinyl hydrolase 1 n=1 Tax=Macrostomum lignano TaxID=282301 RepID=A0A1I8GQF8_9PLAT